MSDTILYQSVLQKLGQLSPNNLAQLDAFLTGLIGYNSMPIKEKDTINEDKSAIYWLEQLAKINAMSSIEDPVEWQREIRQDRKFPFR